MKRSLFAVLLAGVYCLCAAMGALASGDLVSVDLVRRAAQFYGQERWPGCRLASLTPYYALDGSINAYAAQFTLPGCTLSSEAELSAAVGQARTEEAAVRAERRDGAGTAKQPDHGFSRREVNISLAPTEDGRGPAQATVDASALRSAAATRAERAASAASHQAWRERVRAAANQAVLLGRVGTVILSARSDVYPLLERFDGVAPHLKFEHTLREITRREPAGDLAVRAYYLGPMCVFLDLTAPAHDGLTTPATNLVDPMNQRTFLREDLKNHVGAGGRLEAAPAGKGPLSPEAFWRAIEDYGMPPLLGGGDAGGSTGTIAGVPYYHQDDYGAACCGPTASAQALGYWNDHGYGNLVDNGTSSTGHEDELIYDLMRAQGYAPSVGTYGSQIEPGIEAVCNNAEHANNLNFAVTSDYSISWSEITTEINNNRPFVFFNWTTSSYPYWAHFTTGTGYNDNSNHILQVHYNYPPDTPYELNWDNISSSNQAMYRISPSTTTPFHCVMSEDFEGAFPGATWTVGSNGSSPGYWDDTSYRSRNSTPDPSPPGGNVEWSVYCVDSHVPAPGPYPNNVNGWAIYGPFSTMGKTSGEFSAYIWRYIPSGGSDSDYIGLFASVNGADFYGWVYWGDVTAWTKVSLDLGDVWTIGSVLGKSQVWVALWAHSDASSTAEGGYFDDVVLKLSQGTASGARAPIMDLLMRE